MAKTFIGYLKYTPAGFRRVIYRDSITPTQKITLSDSKAENDKDISDVVNWLMDLMENNNTLYPLNSNTFDEDAKDLIESILDDAVNNHNSQFKTSVKFEVVENHDYEDGNGPRQALKMSSVYNDSKHVEYIYIGFADHDPEV